MELFAKLVQPTRNTLIKSFFKNYLKYKVDAVTLSIQSAGCQYKFLILALE